CMSPAPRRSPLRIGPAYCVRGFAVRAGAGAGSDPPGEPEELDPALEDPELDESPPDRVVVPLLAGPLDVLLGAPPRVYPRLFTARAGCPAAPGSPSGSRMMITGGWYRG